jgi:GTPase SAR1 family protein
MMGEEVAIVAIVFGSVLTIVFLGIVGSIINNIIKRKSKGNLSENKEFLAALREFKEKTDQRLSNLEAIVSDESPSKTSSRKLEKKAEQKRAIEIEIDDHSEENPQKDSGKLKNMLNQ